MTALAAALATPIGLIAALGAAIGFLVVTAVQKLGGLSAIWAAIANGAKTAAETIKSGFSGAIGAIVAGFAGIGGLIADALNSLVLTVGGVWEAIRAKAAEVGTGITGVFNTAVQTVVGYFNSLRDRVMAIFDSVISAAKNVLAAVKAALSVGGGAGGNGKAPAFSRGGHVRGPGTGTSDSIPAYLSDGEFVMKRRAVDHYGARFFGALNAMRVPLSAIGQRFANGGLVSAAQALMPPIQHFRDGGLAQAALASGGGSGGRTVNFNISGQTYTMQTDDDTVRRLERHAAAKSLRSSGRKPSWVR